MFERLVVGVDPGTAATGVAAVAAPGASAGSGPAVLRAETVRTSPRDHEARRLRALYEALREILREHRPEALAVERLMWGKNAGSAMGVARATGVALLAAEELGIAVHEYAPLEVKMAITGSGSAAKDQVRRALERLHRVTGVPKEPDAADAVAVAVCHLHQARVGRIDAGARARSRRR